MALREINVDLDLHGKIAAASGSYSTSLTVSGIPVSLTPITIANGIAYFPDNTRSGKYLSVDRATYPFSNDGSTDSIYLDCGSAQANEAAWVIPRNATITMVTLHFVTGPAGKVFEIRKNNSVTALKTYSVNPATPQVSTENIDLSASDRLQVFVGATGSAAYDPTVSIEVAWRL